MTTANNWMLVATFPEWLNWIAIGRIRCNGRISRVPSPDDHRRFAMAMDRTPDVSIDEDQAFVLAILKSDFRSRATDVTSSDTPDIVWLPLDSVAEFLPVSERGARLLEGDAHRAGVNLGTPIFEKAWQTWKAGQRAARAELRGLTFSRVLGLANPDLSIIHGSILPILLGDRPLPNAEKLGALRSTRASAWASAFALSGLLVGEDVKRSLTEQLSLHHVVKQLRSSFSIAEPILADSPYIETADALTLAIHQHAGTDASVRQWVVVLHYAHAIETGQDIELSSLVKDLGAVVVDAGPVGAANAAYLIGRQMSDIAVTSLAYAKAPEQFSCLRSRSLPYSLDVLAAVTAQQDEEQLKNQPAPLVEGATIPDVDGSAGASGEPKAADESSESPPIPDTGISPLGTAPSTDSVSPEELSNPVEHDSVPSNRPLDDQPIASVSEVGTASPSSADNPGESSGPQLSLDVDAPHQPGPQSSIAAPTARNKRKNR